MRIEPNHESKGHKEHSSHEGHDDRENPDIHSEHAGHGSHHSHKEHGEQMHGETKASKIPVKVEWTASPEKLESNQEIELKLLITDASGKAIPSFTIVHEKEMHLLAISRDLTVFQHLHPVYSGAGQFKVKVTFPKPGRYKLYADFLPEGANQQLASHELVVEGEENTESIVPDIQRQKTINGLNFELVLPEVRVDEHIKLSFKVSDASGNPVTELEPYLGSAGHVVIINETMEEFLHVHPSDETTTGPDVEYMTSFPTEGIYKIWGQFKFKGELYTVPFVIEVGK